MERNWYEYKGLRIPNRFVLTEEEKKAIDVGDAPLRLRMNTEYYDFQPDEPASSARVDGKS